jgi:hypothetical protein
MATNKSMINLLERAMEVIDELNAINKVLRRHIAEQKRQPGRDFNDQYVYEKKRKETPRFPLENPGPFQIFGPV